MDELLNQKESSSAEAKNERLDEEAVKLDAYASEMREIAERILEHGCIIRHLEKGCVEFLSRRNGEPVYLCWRRGDTKIRYYRRVRAKETECEMILNGSAEEV
jgi:hypothetical protein